MQVESLGPMNPMNELFALVVVSGPDTRDFLQGQLTQDLRRLIAAEPASGHAVALPAAWCNPSGRVIATARLFALDDAVGMALPASLAQAVVERFAKYRLRAKVDIAVAEGWQAQAIREDGDLALLERAGLLPEPARDAARQARGVFAVETGAEPRCVEVHGCAAAMAEAGLAFSRPLTEDEWRLALISAGIPLIEAGAGEQYTPHMLNLDLLGAVSFTKGCYTGQEVIARTEHRGRTKRRLGRWTAPAEGIAPGEKVSDGEREVGEVVNAAGRELLAVVPLDLHGTDLHAAGKPLSPLPLPYALPA